MDLGLKEKVIGGAKVSEKHANFIVNFNKAKSSDIISLINLIQEKVLKESTNLHSILVLLKVNALRYLFFMSFEFTFYFSSIKG